MSGLVEARAKLAHDVLTIPLSQARIGQCRLSCFTALKYYRDEVKVRSI